MARVAALGSRGHSPAFKSNPVSIKKGFPPDPLSKVDCGDNVHYLIKILTRSGKYPFSDMNNPYPNTVYSCNPLVLFY